MFKKRLLTCAAISVAVLTGFLAAKSDASTLDQDSLNVPDAGDTICEATTGMITGRFPADDTNNTSPEPDGSVIDDTLVDQTETDGTVEKDWQYTRRIVLDANYVTANNSSGVCELFVLEYDPDETDGLEETETSSFTWAGSCRDDLSNCSTSSSKIVAISVTVLPNRSTPIGCITETEDDTDDRYAVTDAGFNLGPKDGQDGNAGSVAVCSFR